MEMPDEVIELSESEVACLDAVREGLASKTRIAVAASRDFRVTTRALEALRRAQLVSRGDDASWRVTPRGRRCSVRPVPDPQPRRGQKPGTIVAGSAVDRLPAILDRPMRGAELAARLGVTPQRIHQIVVRLLACDAVRIGDSAHILHIVARTDDPSVLLTRDDERVLSALPEAATTASAIASVTHMPVARVQDGLARLCELHLVNNAETRRGRALYRLSPAGNAHFQRRRGMQRAKPALLVVKSDRVRDVLSYLSGQGPARTRDVRDALGIALPSINALMQYLKRRGLVKKAADKLNAPYALTEAGRAALAEMIRRAA